MSEPSVKRFPHHSEDSLYKIMGPGIPGDRISSYLGGPDLLTMKLISRNTNDMMKTHKPVDSNGQTRLRWALSNFDDVVSGNNFLTNENAEKQLKRYVDIIYEESQKYSKFEEIKLQSVLSNFSTWILSLLFSSLSLYDIGNEKKLHIISQLSKAIVKIISVQNKISFRRISYVLLSNDEDEYIYFLQQQLNNAENKYLANCFGDVLIALINKYEGGKKELCTRKFTGIGNWVNEGDTKTTLIGNYRRRLKRAADMQIEENILNIRDINEFERVLQNNFPIYWKMYSILQHTCKDYDSEND